MTGAPQAETLFTPSDATPMSTDESTVKPWRDARRCLETAPKIWLSTARSDGRPHVMPVMAVWVRDAPYLTTRPTSRKGRNLIADPRCVITVSCDDLDLVVEGIARHTTDDDEIRSVSSAFLSKYAWEFTVGDGVVRDDGLPGAPEYFFFSITPTRAFGYGADGLTATRWRFTEEP
ncbi:pyridoxamine 5'-phosphate oxidase family protein [Gordonia sp. LSe1-13]|uniref:Pyridoxamine 5'-phosphate oxidase family protein n=1 Tax=Gordonia sesuvii TaxID=3116777 RepID=A0ABU7MD97_9ACTN|nr:pyridoxamine 5'-phosphate oxidase family protein [Gordonia sp. LSe1-13]